MWGFAGISHTASFADVLERLAAYNTPDAMEALPRGLLGEAVYGTLTEDVTSYLQDFIDRSGRSARLPNGTFPVAGLRGKSNFRLDGDGWGTVLKKPNASVLTTAAKKRANVVEMLDGYGFGVRNLRIEGNYSRGGLNPPFAVRWTGSTAYVTNQVVSTKADGTVAATNAELTAANGARTFLVLQNHTSHATDIDNDVSGGNVQEVTSQVWDELTGTGYLASADVDASYAYRHGLYLHGESDFITDCYAENVEVTDCQYGGLTFGSGPLYATGVGVGAKRLTTMNCYGHGNKGSNFGGGFNTFCRHFAPRTFGGQSSGIRFDSGSDDSQMICPIVDGNSTLTNGGILLYESDRCKVLYPVVRNASLAIWIVNSLLYSMVEPDVLAQTVTITNSTAAEDMRFGVYTAGAAADSTGYITVKDSAGNTRKLMVQA